MNSEDATQAAIATAQELQEELEVVADSDLPFAYDAEQILEALRQEEGKDQ